MDLYNYKDFSVPEEILEEWEYIYWLLNPYRKNHFTPGKRVLCDRKYWWKLWQKESEGNREREWVDVSKGLVGPGKEWEWIGKESVEEIVRRRKEVPRLLREEQRVLEGQGLG